MKDTEVRFVNTLARGRELEGGGGGGTAKAFMISFGTLTSPAILIDCRMEKSWTECLEEGTEKIEKKKEKRERAREHIE